MSSVSGIGVTPSIQPVSSQGTVTAPSTSGTASTNTTLLSNLTFSDSLGIPLNGGSLGLPTSGAPGDAEAVLAAILLKLQQTVGQTRNNAEISSASRSNQALALIASLNSAIATAANQMAADGLQFNQDSIQIAANRSKMHSDFAKLLGSDVATGTPETVDVSALLAGSTADATGAHGDYGIYLSLRSKYDTADSNYQSASKQVQTDQSAIDAPALYKSQTLDPLVNEQTTLQAKVTNKIPLSPAEQQRLTTLNGDANTAGSVLNARQAYQGLVNQQTTAQGRLASDQAAANTAYSALVTAQTNLAPYLDTGSSPGTVIDNHPKTGGSNILNFDPRAVQSLGTNQQGKISQTIADLTSLASEISQLKSDQDKLTSDVASQSAVLNQNNAALTALSISVALVAAQSGQTVSDDVVSLLGKLADIVLTQRSFENIRNNIEGLNAAQDKTQQLQSLVRQIVQALTSQPIQAALKIANELEEALSTLSGLAGQPSGPTSTDTYSTGGPRLRIPV